MGLVGVGILLLPGRRQQASLLGSLGLLAFPPPPVVSLHNTPSEKKDLHVKHLLVDNIQGEDFA
jgi:hypothetical protein